MNSDPLAYRREDDPCFKFSQKGSLACEVAVALLAIAGLAALLACKFAKVGKLNDTAFIALAGTGVAIPFLLLMKRVVPKAYTAYQEHLKITRSKTLKNAVDRDIRQWAANVIPPTNALLEARQWEEEHALRTILPPLLPENFEIQFPENMIFEPAVPDPELRIGSYAVYHTPPTFVLRYDEIGYLAIQQVESHDEPADWKVTAWWTSLQMLEGEDGINPINFQGPFPFPFIYGRGDQVYTAPIRDDGSFDFTQEADGQAALVQVKAFIATHLTQPE